MVEYPTRPDRLDIPFQQIRLFADAINASGMHVRNLISAGKLHAVKDGRATKIIETPRQFLESLPPYKPGTMKAGPGRPRRRPEEQA
jgi:hypothetical protein